MLLPLRVEGDLLRHHLGGRHQRRRIRGQRHPLHRHRIERDQRELRPDERIADRGDVVAGGVQARHRRAVGIEEGLPVVVCPVLGRHAARGVHDEVDLEPRGRGRAGSSRAADARAEGDQRHQEDHRNAQRPVPSGSALRTHHHDHPERHRGNGDEGDQGDGEHRFECHRRNLHAAAMKTRRAPNDRASGTCGRSSSTARRTPPSDDACSAPIRSTMSAIAAGSLRA